MCPAPPRSRVISQNFLRSRVLVDRLLATSTIRRGDLVLDLGAGGGLITERLVERGCRVIAVEKDGDLVASLGRRFADSPGVSVRHADILELRLPLQPYKVFANIPFDATAAIVQHLTRSPCPPEDAYLVVQREAAARLLGRPRGTLLSALLFPWFELGVVHQFRRTDFTPLPSVEVVLLRLRKRGPPLVAPERASLVRDFLVFVFTGPRCSLGDRLADLFGRRRARLLMRRLAIPRAVTPSALSPMHWLELAAAFEAMADARARGSVAGAERRLRNQHRHLRKLHRTRTRPRRRPTHDLRWAQRGGLDSSCRPPPSSRYLGRCGLRRRGCARSTQPQRRRPGP